MAAIPVTSDETYTNPVQPLETDQWTDHERRLIIIERAALAELEARIAALEAEQITATATLNFPSIAAGTVQTLTITVTGAATGDAVALGPPAALEAGLMSAGRVSAANTVTIRLFNGTAAAIDPASATWRATVFK